VRVTLSSFVFAFVACASASAQSAVVRSRAKPLDSRVIISPVDDTILDAFMPIRANYQCAPWLLYDLSGPMSVGCSATTGDTLWVVYQDTTMHALIAAAKNIAVPIDSLDAVAIRLENEMTIRFGSPDSCSPQAQTLRHWRWWPAGKYTVQLRIVDPTSVYRPVRRGRVEVQAIPVTATVCITWVHEPLPPQ
jgi:hypothetical protein